MFANRNQAGEVLAELLAVRGYDDVVILAVPRGGIIVAAPIAKRLGTRIEVLVTRKVGHPANPEVAIGAVMADGTAVLDRRLIRAHGVDQSYLDEAVAREAAEVRRRMVAYSGTDKPPPVAGRTAIVIDDGIATGYTLRAAIGWLRTLAPAKIVVAVPVAPPETVTEFTASVDEVICPLQPANFMAVGLHYRDFGQNTDEEVLAALREVNGG
jgi:putative phosphoribosyl transferase